MLHKKIPEPLVPLIGAVVFLIIWWLCTAFKLVDPFLLPSPLAAGKAMWTGIFNGTLSLDMLITIRRTVYAFLIAVVICVPLGLVLGSSQRIYRSCEFVIDFFRSTPASALFLFF